MPALFVFLLKVNIALLLFCAGYYLVLRPLTFYTLNRIYLLAAIVFASIYPLINLSAFVQRHEELAKPVLNWQLPAQNLVKPLSEPTYWYWIAVTFWLGASVLAIRLAVQLFFLYRLYKTSKPATINTHTVRIMDKDAAPFSFWQSIFVNPDKHDPADLNAILLHEQVHVSQWHTADILLAELSSIFYWFNPGIWLMKKAIRENIEFITDRKILNKGIDSKSYQYSLVSVSFNNQKPGIVNHFNISTIKKRIIMMNAKRSSRLNLTRYAFLVPAVMVLLLVFSISKADFAKPIRISLTNAVKPLATIVHMDAVPPPISKVTFAKPKKLNHKIAQAVQLSKADTSKKLVINKDSIVYYINGVKGDIKSVAPANIASLNIFKGESASAYLDKNAPQNTAVAIVITRDSPDGKAFEELNGQYKSLKQSNDVVTGSIVNHNTGLNKAVVIGRGALVNSATKTNLPLTTMASVIPGTFAVTVSPNANVNQQKKLTSTWHTVATYTYSNTKDADTTVVIKGKIADIKSTSKVSITGKTSTIGLTANGGKGLYITNDKGKVPLILVDGKEISAADATKMDASQMTSIEVIQDSAAKKYGEKAKDGVILITTKK